MERAPSVFSNADLLAAKSKWSTCNGLGSRFPNIEVGTGSGRPVTIEFKPIPNPNQKGTCEEVEKTTAGHTLLRATITIYAKQANGTPCQPLSEDIGHAIGHIFGLGDAKSGACIGSLMGRRQQGSTRKKASPSECSEADKGWQMLKPEPPPFFGPPKPPFTPCRLEPDRFPLSTTLPLAGVSAVSDPASFPLFSNRTEVVGDILYLMEDWAILAHQVGAQGEVLSSETLSSSSLRFLLEGSVSRPPDAGQVEGQTSVSLLVQGPDHPHNERHVHPPRVELLPTAVPYLGEPLTAAVRVDFGEDRQLRGAELLFVSAQLPQGIDLAAVVSQRLALRYMSSKEHRVIVFAVVEVHYGAVLLRQSLVSLPECCCTPLCV